VDAVNDQLTDYCKVLVAAALNPTRKLWRTMLSKQLLVAQTSILKSMTMMATDTYAVYHTVWFLQALILVRLMPSWLYMQVVALSRRATCSTSGASNGRCLRSVRRTVSNIEIYTLYVTYKLLGVKVYGFMTVPEDASCGVCAHELGHLGKL
jgi:hypothetical protein